MYTSGATFVTGQEYEIEVGWSETAGDAWFHVDGVRVGYFPLIGTRSDTSAVFYVGSLANVVNAKIRDFIVYDTMQHGTDDYIPDWSEIYETVYLESKVELPQFSYPGIGAIQAYTGVASTETNAPRQVWNDLYWTGSAWTTSNGTPAQANVVADILANIATFPASDTLDVDIIFADGNDRQSMSNLEIEYTGQIYSTSNPTLEVVQGFNLDGLINFIETSVKAGSDELKYILKKDSSWYYWDGAAWAISDETYAQSNTASEIIANVGSFTTTGVAFNSRIFFHSGDGATTPTIQQLEIIFDFAGNPESELSVSEVYWYARNPDGTVCTDVVTATLSAANVRYKDNIFLCREDVTATPDPITGYVELKLAENANMLDQYGNAVTYKLQQGTKTIGRISVPDTDGSLLWDILV